MILARYLIIFSFIFIVSTDGSAELLDQHDLESSGEFALADDSYLGSHATDITFAEAANTFVATFPEAGSTYYSKAGAIKVFSYSDDHWVEKGEAIVGEATQEEIGCSLSLSASGERIAVSGGCQEQSVGVARVYEWKDQQWQQLGETLKEQWPNHVRFGQAVALSGDGETLAVSAYGSHRVYVYTWSSDHWQEAMLPEWKTAGIDQLTQLQLSMDGKRLLVTGVKSKGGARLFQLTEKGWQELETFRVSSESDYDQLKTSSPAMNPAGDTVVISYPQVAGQSLGNRRDSGVIQTFTEGNNWNQLGAEINGVNYALLGRQLSLSVDGKTLYAFENRENKRIIKYVLEQDDWIVADSLDFPATKLIFDVSGDNRFIAFQLDSLDKTLNPDFSVRSEPVGHYSDNRKCPIYVLDLSRLER